ncbi:MAG TPA: hypothetical protein VM487_15635 [Phycisphaerae bacterium]|nr:hypothetical protein [Phycisphaerae bacterium]
MSKTLHEAHGLEALQVARRVITELLERWRDGGLSAEETSAIIDAAAGLDLDTVGATPSAEIRAMISESADARTEHAITLARRKLNMAQLRLIGEFVANLTTTVLLLSRTGEADDDDTDTT